MERCYRCGSAPAPLRTATGRPFCTLACFKSWVRIRRLVLMVDLEFAHVRGRHVEVVVPDSRYL